MKLAKLSPEMLQKAVAVFCELAYPDGKTRSPLPDFSAAKSIDQALSQFQNESGRDVEKKLHRYTLRLGNSRYPFMKLVVQEVLIEGEYFLSVDTHDEMEIKPSFPDYEKWKELKSFNAKLKTEIEKRWEKQGIPTGASLQNVACELMPESLSVAKQHRILVVDDDQNIRETVAALLAARGYLIEVASDGEEALQKVEQVKPNLIVMDYEMPVLDGVSTIEKLRQKNETKKIPVLLATAGQISLDQIQKANGFLVKPFQRQVLFSLVDNLLGAKPKSSGGILKTISSYANVWKKILGSGKKG